MKNKYKEFKFVYPNLNNIYTLRYYNTLYFCRFVKSTEKGYNFLNLKNNKYIFKHHLYTQPKKHGGFAVNTKFIMYDGIYYEDKKYDKIIRGVKLKLLLNIS